MWKLWTGFDLLNENLLYGGGNIKKLIDYIENAKYYQKEFADWEAFEQIIDENKAFWMLKKPGSLYQKVCLYRDGYNMFVYGDYGQFTFDSMTWTGSVYNLEYDNIGYQMEKLSHESRQSLKVFDEYKCREDITCWLKYQLEEYYNLENEEIEKVVSFIENIPCSIEIDDFCNNKNPFFDIEDILMFTKDCFENTEEYEWISFLRRNYNKFYDFGDEPSESWLWNAGKCIHQRYFVCMYALQVCGEKLKEQIFMIEIKEYGMSKEHHPKSKEIYNFISQLDFENGDVFYFKSGGDGDNGECLMDLLDYYFLNKEGMSNDE